MQSLLNYRRLIKLDEDLNKIYDEYYSEGKPNFIERQSFDRVIALDPTFNHEVPIETNKLGNYGKWLLTRFKKGQLPEESFGNVTEILNDFNERKKYLNNAESKGPGKEANKGVDINAYKSIEEVRAALDCIELTDNQRAKINRKAKHYADLGDEAEFIVETDDWEVWKPLTYPADAKLGAGTTWCTASSSGDRWFNRYTVAGTRYSDNGCLYIFLNKNDPKLKFQARVGLETRKVTDFMNADDNEVDFIEFIAANGLVDALFTTELKDVSELEEAKKLMNIFNSETIYVLDAFEFDRERYRPMISVSSKENNEDYMKIRVSSLLSTSNKIRNIIFMASSNPNSPVMNDTKFEKLDFSRCSDMKSITPYSLKHNKKLVSVILPNSISVIGREAFSDCSNLKDVNIPTSLKIIEYRAFKDCPKVKLLKEKGQKIRVTKEDAIFIKNHIEIIGEPDMTNESVTSTSLVEGFSSTMPNWLSKYITDTKFEPGETRKNGKSNARYGLSKLFGIDLQNAEFITPSPKPISGGNKYCKAPYIGIFHIVYGSDNQYNHLDLVFIKDFETGSCFGGNIKAPWFYSYRTIDDCSISTLLSYSNDYCCIDKTNIQNFVGHIQQNRKSNFEGSIVRYPEKEAEKIVKRMNSLNYADEHVSADKSGYIVDPQNLINKLNQYNRQHYSKVLQKYYKRLKEIKKLLIHEYENIDIKNSYRTDEIEINNMFKKLNDAINLYRRCIDSLENVLEIKDKKEKTEKLNYLFSNSNIISNLRNIIVKLEQQMRKHSFEVIECLDLEENFKNWAGELLYSRFKNILKEENMSKEFSWWMNNKTPIELEDYLNSIK